jgi:hypothetical protein
MASDAAGDRLKRFTKSLMLIDCRGRIAASVAAETISCLTAMVGRFHRIARSTVASRLVPCLGVTLKSD